MIRISFLNDVIINNYQTILIYPYQIEYVLYYKSIYYNAHVHSFKYDQHTISERVYTFLNISSNLLHMYVITMDTYEYTTNFGSTQPAQI